MLAHTCSHTLVHTHIHTQMYAYVDRTCTVQWLLNGKLTSGWRTGQQRSALKKRPLSVEGSFICKSSLDIPTMTAVVHTDVESSNSEHMKPFSKLSLLRYAAKYHDSPWNLLLPCCWPPLTMALMFSTELRRMYSAIPWDSLDGRVIQKFILCFDYDEV